MLRNELLVLNFLPKTWKPPNCANWLGAGPKNWGATKLEK